MDLVNKYFNTDMKSSINGIWSKIFSLVSDNGLILLVIMIKSLVLLVVGWWIINKISKVALVFLKKACTDYGITSFLSSLLKFSLRVMLIVIVMSSLGFDVTSILAAIGASMIAVGFSIKESLSNFISGIVLIINKPIHAGDFIEFGNFAGRVMRIEMLFTTLQTEEEGKTVVIPNAKLVSDVIVRKGRFDISNLNLTYTFSDIIPIKNLDKYLIKEFILNDSIIQIPEPKIKLETTSENKTLIKISISCQEQKLLKVQNDIGKIIDKIANKYGVTFETENINKNNCS